MPGTEQPDGLQSTGSRRVGPDWATEHNGKERLNVAIHVKCLDVPGVISNIIINFCHYMCVIVI